MKNNLPFFKENFILYKNLIHGLINTIETYFPLKNKTKIKAPTSVQLNGFLLFHLIAINATMKVHLIQDHKV